MYLDLSELDQVFAGRWCWSTRRLAPMRFRRGDHLGDPAQPLDDAVRDLVAARGRPRPSGPIRLLTQLRHFGFVMNPVSFYFCFDARGERTEAIVAEVNNTPWGEQHCYLLDPAAYRGSGGVPPEVPKEFHVSPFLPMDLQYHWQVTEPGEKLSVGLRTCDRGRSVLDVQLDLARRPLTRASLTWAALRYPLMTWRVFQGIYWQALRLAWKRCPFYPHPKKHYTLTDETARD